MPKFSEETLIGWTKPPSDSEASKLSNAERMVRKAINSDPKLLSIDTEIFGQGSYANDTNVRLNSDIDINVQFTGGFYFRLPPNTKREEFGLNNPIDYSIAEFKDDVHRALVNKFGAESILRKNKCITVLANNYRVETDVVPTWRHRRYSENRSFVEGAELKADSGETVINYPKQHIENGIDKNRRTSRRFKRLTRLYRKIRYKMIEDGIPVSDAISSFLLECLTWNVPDFIYNENDNWQDRLRNSIVYIYESTDNPDRSTEWGEVSELLYLFYDARKWSQIEVRDYMQQVWDYLEY